MKNSIKIKIAGEASLELYPGDIEKIVRDYDGNTKAYLIDRWRSLVSLDEASLEAEKVSFVSKEAEEDTHRIIADYRRKKSEIDKEALLFRLRREVAYGSEEKKEDYGTRIMVSDEDREILKNIYPYVKKEGYIPIRSSMDYIHFDGERFTATDEYRIAQFRSKTKNQPEYFIPDHFAMALSEFQEAELYLSTQEDKDFIVLRFRSGDGEWRTAKHLFCINKDVTLPVKMSDMQHPDLNGVLEQACLHPQKYKYENAQDVEQLIVDRAPKDGAGMMTDTVSIVFPDKEEVNLVGYQYREVNFSLYNEICYKRGANGILMKNLKEDRKLLLAIIAM